MMIFTGTHISVIGFFIRKDTFADRRNGDDAAGGRGLLPFEFGDFTDDVQMYVREVKKFAAQQQEEIKERNHEIEEGVLRPGRFRFFSKDKYVPPAKEEVPPFLNFAPLDQ